MVTFNAITVTLPEKKFLKKDVINIVTDITLFK